MCLTPFKSTTTTCNSREWGANLPPVFSLAAFYPALMSWDVQWLTNVQAFWMKERQRRAQTRGQQPTTVTQRHSSVGSVTSVLYRQISSQMCSRECRCVGVPYLWRSACSVRVSLQSHWLSACCSLWRLVTCRLAAWRGFLSVLAGFGIISCLLCVWISLQVPLLSVALLPHHAYRAQRQWTVDLTQVTLFQAVLSAVSSLEREKL